jgi:hypothetical protein
MPLNHLDDDAAALRDARQAEIEFHLLFLMPLAREAHENEYF